MSKKKFDESVGLSELTATAAQHRKESLIRKLDLQLDVLSALVKSLDSGMRLFQTLNEQFHTTAEEIKKL